MNLENFEQGLSWESFFSRIQMHRNQWRENLTKDINIPDGLAQIIQHYPHHLKVVGIFADWCGDAVQEVPAIINLLQLNPQIEVRIFIRDDHPDLMDQYLTNGGKAIPKFVIFSDQFDELAQWGPRPAGAQAVLQHEKSTGATVKEYWPKIQAWYLENHPLALWQEWAEIFRMLTR